MFEQMQNEINDLYPNQAFLSLDDISKLLGCSTKVVYNWTRRTDPAKRPPRLVIGKTIRFPKGPFIQWLLKEQGVQ